MLQDNVVIEVERRHETGKNSANRLREKDLIPAVIYGGGSGMEALSLAVPRKALQLLFRKGLHENAVFLLSLKGTDQKRHVMVRDVTVHPVSRALLHVDFVRVLLDKKLKVRVPIEVVGTAVGVKMGGLLGVVTHELYVECLPADIPRTIPVDVTALEAGQALRVSDLPAGEKVRLLDRPDLVVAHVSLHRGEEAPAAEAAAAAPEPEVLKKGKKEEEGAAKPGAPAAKAEKKEKK